VEAKAIAKHVRISPQKVRLVVDMVRGRRVEEALGVLNFTTKRAAKIVAKTLRSAVANAENNLNLDVDRLFVKSAQVGEGPTWKRIMPRAQGRATPIFKRTSHITIVLDEKE
jgi:large subunit ribosomal protein L22